MKESIYGLISELLTSSQEFNTSLELMQEFAFIGEAAIGFDNWRCRNKFQSLNHPEVCEIISLNIPAQVHAFRPLLVLVTGDVGTSSRT